MPKNKARIELKAPFKISINIAIYQTRCRKIRSYGNRILSDPPRGPHHSQPGSYLKHLSLGLATFQIATSYSEFFPTAFDFLEMSLCDKRGQGIISEP